MENRLPSPDRPYLCAVFSSSLTAAFLNLGTSALDHPRAFSSTATLGLVLTMGWAVLLAAALPWFGLGDALGSSLGLAPRALRHALAVTFVLAAALAPPVEVGLRGASSARAGVVLALAGGLVVSAALTAYAFGSRWSQRPAGTRSWASVAPLGALAGAFGLWFAEFHGPAVAGAALGASGLALAFWIAGRVDRGHVLGAQVLFVIASGITSAFHGPPSPSPGRPASSDRPPVVLITVDTLRADRVLDAGPEAVSAPTIAALAADSVVFTHARSAAPWTKPALATLLTGLSPLVHGMTNRRARLPDEVETLAERLRGAGYRTAGIGLNAHLERAFGLDQGFDDYAFPARPDHGISLGARLLERWKPARYPELFPSTEAIADVAVDWLQAQAGEPFFLWLHVLDPHWPYEPPAKWLAEPEREPSRWGEPDMVTAVQAGNTKPGAAERERVQQLYAGEIRYVDAELARVVATLRELRLYERALIVFASDHGEEFWEHGRYEHGHTLYDEVLRVPLFFKLPGDGARARVNEPVTTEALVPTVLDVLGLPYEPELLSSRSLAPWWSAPGSAPSDALFSTGTYYFGEKRAVVFDEKKLVVELDTGRLELFDLAGDPRELRSLTSSSHADVQRGLELIETWEERCRALRERLDISGREATEADAETLRLMHDLGYAGDDEP